MSIDDSVSSYDSDESDNAYDSDESDDSDDSDKDEASERLPSSQISRKTNQEADTSEFNDDSTQSEDEVVRLKFFSVKQLKFKHFVNAIEYDRAEQDNDWTEKSDLNNTVPQKKNKIERHFIPDRICNRCTFNDRKCDLLQSCSTCKTEEQ